MAWIRTVPVEEAQGVLARIYEGALARAGRIWQIVRVTSLRATATQSSLRLYQDVMFGEGVLSRAERELIATVVSRINDCHY